MEDKRIFGDLDFGDDDTLVNRVFELLPEETLAQTYNVSHDFRRLSEYQYQLRQTGSKYWKHFFSRGGLTAPNTLEEYNDIAYAIQTLAKKHSEIRSEILKLGIGRLVSIYDVVKRRVMSAIDEKKRWGDSYPIDLDPTQIGMLHDIFRQKDTAALNLIFYKDIVDKMEKTSKLQIDSILKVLPSHSI